jgi:hypothetical protein
VFEPAIKALEPNPRREVAFTEPFMKKLPPCAFIAALAATLSAHAMATEIAPTPKMLAAAEQMIKIEYPAENEQSFKYHFRNLGGHILWCAHPAEGNGGFCTKITPRYVADTDRSAVEFCKTAAEHGDDTAPHAVYGELFDLSYRCAHGRMSRLPVDMAVDREGYVRSQWRPLP